MTCARVKYRAVWFWCVVGSPSWRQIRYPVHARRPNRIMIRVSLKMAAISLSDSYVCFGVLGAAFRNKGPESVWNMTGFMLGAVSVAHYVASRWVWNSRGAGRILRHCDFKLGCMRPAWRNQALRVNSQLWVMRWARLVLKCINTQQLRIGGQCSRKSFLTFFWNYLFVWNAF